MVESTANNVIEIPKAIPRNNSFINSKILNLFGGKDVIIDNMAKKMARDGIFYVGELAQLTKEEIRPYLPKHLSKSKLQEYFERLDNVLSGAKLSTGMCMPFHRAVRDPEPDRPYQTLVFQTTPPPYAYYDMGQRTVIPYEEFSARL